MTIEATLWEFFSLFKAAKQFISAPFLLNRMPSCISNKCWKTFLNLLEPVMLRQRMRLYNWLYKPIVPKNWSLCPHQEVARSREPCGQTYLGSFKMILFKGDFLFGKLPYSSISFLGSHPKSVRLCPIFLAGQPCERDSDSKVEVIQLVNLKGTWDLWVCSKDNCTAI